MSLLSSFRKLEMFLVAPTPNKKQRYPNGYLCFLAGLDGVVTIGVLLTQTSL